jgi:hypothetical protein
MTTPKIAIVTPWNGYHAEWFAECRASVEAQTLKVDHVLVFDGVTASPGAFQAARQRLIQIPSKPGAGLGHADTGNLARGIGGTLCAAENYDAVCFLDADNWIEPEHMEQLWCVSRTNPDPFSIVVARRIMHTLDGRAMYQEQAEHAAGHVDTNCMFFGRAAFRLLPVWTQIPAEMAHIGDQVFWKVARQWLGKDPPALVVPTVHYRTPYAAHYRAAGLPAPEGAKEVDVRAYKATFMVHGFEVSL